jgi:hypothetical protein
VSVSVDRVETSLTQAEHALSPETFDRVVDLMTSYVRSEDGAYSALVGAANQDPEAMTQSLIALGAVLLDIAAGAFKLTPDEMLVKVSQGIREGVAGATV